MTNTDKVTQDVLDRANRTRLEEYNKFRALLTRMYSISVLVTHIIEQLERDPLFRYSPFPIRDAGPAVPDSDPDYQRPSGCDGCPFRDFAGHD